MLFHAPHFYHGPHVHIFPFLLLLAAALFFFSRRHRFAGAGCMRRDGAPAHRADPAQPRGRDAGAAFSGNTAFESYRAEKLKEMEAEAAEFRAHLDKLRHAEDREAFEAFLKQRKDATPPASASDELK